MYHKAGLNDLQGGAACPSFYCFRKTEAGRVVTTCSEGSPTPSRKASCGVWMGREDEGSDLWEWETLRGLFFPEIIRGAKSFKAFLFVRSRRALTESSAVLRRLMGLQGNVLGKFQQNHHKCSDFLELLISIEYVVCKISKARLF